MRIRLCLLSIVILALVIVPADASVPGTPGTHGVPVLDTSPPLYGAIYYIGLSNGLAGAPVGMLASPTGGPTPTSIGTLGLGPGYIQVLVVGTVSGSGAYSLAYPIPDDAALFDFPINLQAVIQDSANPTGFCLSNSVNMTFYGADLDADGDRDGVVEQAGADDDQDEELWSSARGAVYLHNNDDDDSNGKVDCSDTQVNGAADGLDLAPLLVRAMPDLPAGWSGELTLDGEGSRWSRLFRKQGTSWSFFNPGTSNPISTADLQAGLEFGIEATDYAQTATGAPGQWNGEVLATLVLKDGSGAEKGRDEVRLCVAPFLLYSNLAPGETAYVVKKSSTTAFVNDLLPLVTAAGSALHVIDGTANSYDRWAQDAMEFGYSTLPSPSGDRTCKTVLRAPRGWGLDPWTKDHCMGPDFGYAYKGYYRSGVGWIDWFGNLDVTPPLPGWPLGRIYTGYQASITMHPAILEFLDAQDVQGPVLQIDTEWLVIGHVDEEICFVPANSGTGYRMLIPDTIKALQILQDLQNAGKGSLVVYQGTSDQTTVNGLLNWTNFVNYNTNLQSDIDGVRQVMKNGLGIAEADIIDIPALFWKGNGGNRALAHMPNMVNSLVLGNQFIACDPFGPMDGGVDKFKEPVIQELNAIGLNVVFIDNWTSYHELWGEVHCGTNAVRTPSATPWWTVK